MPLATIYAVMLAIGVLLGCGCVDRAVESRPLMVAAAASLSHVLPRVGAEFAAQGGRPVRFNFGGSNVLARQIGEGLAVDVFLSADSAQMDLVQRAGRLVDGSRVNVLSNQLVIVIPADSPTAVGPHDLGSAAVTRIAMADPGAVPAGVYGRQWLERLDLWRAVAPKVIPSPSSPAALAAVREGHVQAGIVYATDAATQPAVRVSHAVPDGEGPEILYPAAVVAGGDELNARALIAFLTTDAARRVFLDAGFRLPR